MMPDREKVIKGLEILINGCEYIHCDDCCFYISTKPLRCGLREEQIKEDALALLKEQEAVSITTDYFDGFGNRTSHCPSCYSRLVWHQNKNYCGECGKRIEWEGR